MFVETPRGGWSRPTQAKKKGNDQDDDNIAFLVLLCVHTAAEDFTVKASANLPDVEGRAIDGWDRNSAPAELDIVVGREYTENW